VNLVLWKKVFERFEILAKTETFLGVTGRVETQDGVTNFIAERLWRPGLQLPHEDISSRDFH
jgi:error-prone DNA polymerase